jgi:hypothetical protein
LFQLVAVLTEAFELWFFGGRDVGTFQADKPTSGARQHRLEIIAKNAIQAANDVVSHLESPLTLVLALLRPVLRRLASSELS